MDAQHDLVQAILFIRPNAEFVVRDMVIEWLDEKQTQPTADEIKQALIDYKIKQTADKQEAKAKRQVLLDKLGITADEAKLLLQ